MVAARFLKILTALIIGMSSQRSTASAYAFDPCEVCENVLTPILDKATPADRQKVIGVLKNLCFGNQACLDKVDSITGDIVNATAESLCTLVDLCKKSVDKRGELFSFCSLCESSVDSIKSKLGNETIDEIKQKLELICFGNQACIAKVDSVVDQISSASSKEICTELHLCKAGQLVAYNGQFFCNMCEKYAEKYLKVLNNETLAKLDQYLTAACRGNAKCLDAVAKIMSQIAGLTPESVCEAVGLCKKSTFYETIFASDKCDACKQKLLSILSDDNLNKMESDLEKICGSSDACKTELQNVVNNIKANRDSYVAKACQLAHQC